MAGKKKWKIIMLWKMRQCNSGTPKSGSVIGGGGAAIPWGSALPVQGVESGGGGGGGGVSGSNGLGSPVRTAAAFSLRHVGAAPPSPSGCVDETSGGSRSGTGVGHGTGLVERIIPFTSKHLQALGILVVL